MTESERSHGKRIVRTISAPAPRIMGASDRRKLEQLRAAEAQYQRGRTETAVPYFVKTREGMF